MCGRCPSSACDETPTSSLPYHSFHPPYVIGVPVLHWRCARTAARRIAAACQSQLVCFHVRALRRMAAYTHRGHHAVRAWGNDLSTCARRPRRRVSPALLGGSKQSGRGRLQYCLPVNGCAGLHMYAESVCDFTRGARALRPALREPGRFAGGGSTKARIGPHAAVLSTQLTGRPGGEQQASRAGQPRRGPRSCQQTPRSSR